MEIKRITNYDPKTIGVVAGIHYKILTESFLNNFGLSFLEIIYKNLSESKYSIFLVIEEDKGIKGFLLAMTDYSHFLSEAISKNKIKIISIIIKSIIKKPSIAYKIATSLLEVSKESPHAELQFVAILNGYQGLGWGTKILEKLNQEFKNVGIKKYVVGTKSENELSNKFYQKLGFVKTYTKTYFGEELNYYTSPEI
ncbi:MAG: GNAT family N-acetyltransferase [Nitrospira sp.]